MSTFEITRFPGRLWARCKPPVSSIDVNGFPHTARIHESGCVVYEVEGPGIVFVEMVNGDIVEIDVDAGDRVFDAPPSSDFPDEVGVYWKEV